MECTPKFNAGDTVCVPAVGIKGKIEKTDIDTGKIFYFIRLSEKSTAWASEDNIVKE